MTRASWAALPLEEQQEIFENVVRLAGLIAEGRGSWEQLKERLSG